ncbi:MAG: hypothetical protein IKI29_00935 [Clostridia bacterium]|nr:hypothetical protein [Clostridia bacterium]
MKRKSCGMILLFLVFSILLCGCDGLTADTEQLIRPPELTGEIKAIGQALSQGVKGTYSLKYPSSGDRRSAVITEDIDGDGILEAFAFFGKEEDKTPTVHVAMVHSVKGEWKMEAEQTVEAGGVESVEFCDLNHNGKKSVLIGLEVFGSSEKKLAVYDTDNGKLSQRMLQPYTNFLCADLNEDGKNEIFIQLLSPADGVHRASVIAVKKDGIEEISSCLLDQTVKTVGTITLGELSSGQPAVYLDETKGAGAITEVVFFAKGALVNPLLMPDLNENTVTLHNAMVQSRDINGDGIVEIPISLALPVPADRPEAERPELVGWHSFNGDRLVFIEKTIMNLVDYYEITLPEKWADKITCELVSDPNMLTIFPWDAQTQTAGDAWIQVRVFAEPQWKKERESGTAYKEICRNNQQIFAVLLRNSEELSISLEDFRKIFTAKEVEK